MGFFNTIIALFIAISGIIYSSLPFDLQIRPYGSVDMEKFELMWSDEFDGDALDKTKWTGCYHSKGETLVRKGGYWNMDLATVKDGNLHISTEYFENGYQDNGKPGWYSAGLYTKEIFDQKYGYFEVRCILPKGSGMWSAFWLGCNGIAEIGNGGTDGAEIDIFESPFYSTALKNRVSTNIHYDGYGEHLKSQNVTTPLMIANNPYEEYNTYALEWNEDKYIFYVNGFRTGSSAFGGTSQVAEYLLLTVEVGGSDGIAKDGWAGPALEKGAEPTDFIVDYVRVYQYK